MKRKLLPLAGVLAVVIIASAFTGRLFEDEKKPNTMYNYTWYMDPDLMVPSGSTGEINTELARLRSIYPSYVFNNVPSTNLHEYEWGYFPGHIMPVIYTNKP